jgi:hypothetical protein
MHVFFIDSLSSSFSFLCILISPPKDLARQIDLTNTFCEELCASKTWILRFELVDTSRVCVSVLKKENDTNNDDVSPEEEGEEKMKKKEKTEDPKSEKKCKRKIREAEFLDASERISWAVHRHRKQVRLETESDDVCVVCIPSCLLCLGVIACVDVCILVLMDWMCSELDDRICCICMERPAKETLTCSHAFCVECLDEWLLQHNFSCPMCRREACAKEDRWEVLEGEDLYGETNRPPSDDIHEVLHLLHLGSVIGQLSSPPFALNPLRLTL